MTSDWMKVMLEEIARKKAEAAQAQIEQGLREPKAASPLQQADAPAAVDAAHADEATRADKG